MAQFDDIFNFRGEKVVIGASQILGVTLLAGQKWGTLKYASGGSLEIGGPSLTFGQGYLVSASEALSFPMTNTFYLAASGATVVSFLLRGLTNGNT